MDRIPPHNLEAEQAVLAAVVLDNQALITAMEMLQPDDFYLQTHRMIFAAMRELFERSMPVDMITLTDHLQATARLEAAGGHSGVSDLAGRVSTAANVAYWAAIVKDKSLLRQVITENTALVTEAYSEPESVVEFLDRAENKILEIGSRQTRTTYLPVRDVVHDTYSIIQALANNKGNITGVASGYADLDNLTSGFQKGDLVILAGRPSMGKTALALNLVRNAAVDGEKTIAFFSLEMSASQLVMRMLCSESKISLQRVRMGDLRQRDWIPLANASNTLAQTKIFIDDSAALSVLELKAKARRIKAEHKSLDMIVIDYLQLLRGLGTRHSRDSREQEISEISRALKGMAKEMQVPVLALAQLNRGVEQRGDRPRLSDLRESGSLEQDADLIMFVHREKKKKEKDSTDIMPEKDAAENENPITELIIGKQRNGPTDIVRLVFVKEYTKFELFTGQYDQSAMP